MLNPLVTSSDWRRPGSRSGPSPALGPRLLFHSQERGVVLGAEAV
jgi:hypothetical protein